MGRTHEDDQNKPQQRGHRQGCEGQSGLDVQRPSRAGRVPQEGHLIHIFDLQRAKSYKYIWLAVLVVSKTVCENTKVFKTVFNGLQKPSGFLKTVKNR